MHSRGTVPHSCSYDSFIQIRKLSDQSVNKPICCTRLEWSHSLCLGYTEHVGRNWQCSAHSRRSTNDILLFPLSHRHVPGCFVGEGLHRGTLTRTGAWQTSSLWSQRRQRLDAKFLIKSLQGKCISAPSINTQPPKILPTHNFFPWNCHEIPQMPFKRPVARP